MAAVAEAVPLRTYVLVLVRYRRVLAVSAALGLLAGLVAVAFSPPLWVSSATVVASTVALDPQAPADQPIRPRVAVTIDTEAAILLSYSVLPRAVTGTSVTPGQLARQTSVTAPPNSRAIRIQVRDRDADQARRLTANLTAAYLDTRRQLLTSRRSEQIAAVRREIAVLSGQQSDFAQLDRSADGRLAASAPVTARLAQLRDQLAGLQARNVPTSEMLRAATVPRRVPSQPEIPIVSCLLLGLVAGGIVISFRERHPAPPRTAADVHRLPIAGDLPVALIGRAGPVDDGAGAWERIADAIGPAPAATLIVSLDGGHAPGAAGTLGRTLVRRGYDVSPLLAHDHDSPASDGAAAAMRQIRARGAHLVGAGPPLSDFGGSLSATQADGVVLMLAPGAVSGRALGTAIEQTHRLGIRVHGVILNNSRQELAEGQIW